MEAYNPKPNAPGRCRAHGIPLLSAGKTCPRRSSPQDVVVRSSVTDIAYIQPDLFAVPSKMVVQARVLMWMDGNRTVVLESRLEYLAK